ncbi:phage/plasmid replication protein, II/X family [Photobacterium damselae subsp. damselae]|uniref:phage/plasmid replication protein, II/X family n=1 Tax=Photobacterium damselae TaxID=38293 RepID=UPI001EEE6C54|nr:phage/plasmid replication protein, II/X family [Photobacterium damselae]UKA24103.1 phage/plasmid replication protein, II/X family [Photobacterium damselae subsp. damselae]
MTSFFIDQLFIQQEYQEGNLPFVGTHVIEKIDLETGEKLPPSVNKKILEGSFSTKLTVRCDGRKVRVEGNPSRWQRVDNLFGLKSIDECVSIYNNILNQLGLPPFTKTTRFHHRQTPDGKSSSLIGNGAEITLIDWTRNHEIGKGREQSFIRGLSSMQIGRARKPKLYPDGNTCNWGEASTWSMTKLYNKAVELQRHLKKAEKKGNQKDDNILKYIKNIIEYCEEKGVVREEHSLRQTMLKRYNLNWYGVVKETDFVEHIQDIENAMKTIHISHDEHETIADQLLNQAIVKSRQAANGTQSYAILWQQGMDLRQILSDSQFYEHKARLKKIGIDIGQKFDVSRLCPTLKRSEVIEVKSLSIPTWYKMPVVETSNILPFKAYA